MRTYICDVRLVFEGGISDLLRDQLFSVDDVLELEGQAAEYYQRVADAVNIEIISYSIYE